jgi:hypothetical protein
MAKEIYDPRTRRMVTVRRPGNLGQLDDEFDYGPQPLPTRDVPIDLRERPIKHDKGYGSGQYGGEGGQQGGLPDFATLMRDVHNIAGVVVLRRGLLGRVVTITSTPQLIINQLEKEGRGYLLLNPAGVVGLTAQGTVFNTGTNLVGATTLASAALGVANYNTGRFTVKAVFNAGAGPVSFDLQTLDPVDGTTWITVQTIFNLTATGNAYVNIGTLGIDVDARILVTVPVGTTITFDMGFVLKDGLEGTSAGATQTIFLGGAGVSPNSGFPLLAGKDRSYYFEENVAMYAVTSGPNLDMNIFEY